MSDIKGLFTIIKFTIKDLVTKKVFIISNIILLIIIIGALSAKTIITSFIGEDETSTLAIVDQDNIFEGMLDTVITQVPENLGYNLVVETDKEVVKEKVANGEIEQAFIVTRNENLSIEYIVKNLGLTTVVPENIVNILENMYRNIQISKLQLSEEQLQQINIPLEIQCVQANDEEVQGDIGFIMLSSLVLFFAIYFFAFQVSTSITTEKTSRIIETLVTSTSPKLIIIGKTIGVGLVGVIQTVVVVGVVYIGARMNFSEEVINSVINLEMLTPALAILTIIYYILGYSLYALLYSVTGATVSKPEEVQAANTPVSLITVLGFYLAYFSMMNPTGNINTFSSIFPISSPFCMPFRIMMGVTTPQEVAISVAILLVTIMLVAHISIKIYTSAILNNGSRLSLKNIIEMYRQKD